MYSAAYINHLHKLHFTHAVECSLHASLIPISALLFLLSLHFPLRMRYALEWLTDARMLKLKTVHNSHQKMLPTDKKIVRFSSG
jgi:hypothetical protein